MIKLLLVLPLAGALVCLLPWSVRRVFAVMLGFVAAECLLVALAVHEVLRGGVPAGAGQWLRIDALSAFHLMLLGFVFLAGSIHAIAYFKGGSSQTGSWWARLFSALWLGSMWAMVLVFVSNNIGIMWVGVEATTLLTAFLICTNVTSCSLEAMWKYILICSVGVAFAFMGTILVAASTVGVAGHSLMFWTELMASAGSLDAGLLRAGFVFLLVGYGTKSGFAPMHNWLPDAHSQAPSPVSAVFSGVLLNSAMYCLLRFMPVVEGAAGNGPWVHDLMILAGLISIVVAAAFILLQRDLKRLLAYSSVEHVGIMALGFGLGGIGTFAALFHSLGHSLAKPLAFISAGRLGHPRGTYDMQALAGSMRVSRVWGVGLFAALLALVGAAPFALFMSELLVARAAIEQKKWFVLALLLAGLGVVFAGVMRYAIPLLWGDRPDAALASSPAAPPEAGSRFDMLFVCVVVLLLVVLGLVIPAPLMRLLEGARAVVEGRVMAL
ncbi:MAG: hypothetical protein A2583_04350 [Bdellovibrionales bacterium RIFOXYD1_FULL_53_11]|nr:MAG: hypothetical protein A2583_04350 [Bdellovibrionales bacterium RIFOXYD1_FULL_53_11]